MSLIPHLFDSEKHVYMVEGAYTLSTSAIIEYNGLRNFGQCPSEALQWASERGTMVHKAVEHLETGLPIPELNCQQEERFNAFLRFKEATGFAACGPAERTMVYIHEGTGQYVGVTPDLPAMLKNDDAIYITDIKTGTRHSGVAREIKHLEWRLQTQSQKEAFFEDDEFVRFVDGREIKRMVIHLNPECGIVKRGGPRLGYEVYTMTRDDSDIWNGAVVMAFAKVAAGIKLAKEPKTLPEDRRGIKLAVYASSDGPLTPEEEEIEPLF